MSKYLGPVMTLAIMLLSILISVAIVVSAHNVPAAIPTALVALGCSVFIVKDWNGVWKPLFTRK